MAHLTRWQREQLQALSRAKHSQREIARILGCTQSTVSRELERNSTGPTRRYTAHIADARAAERRTQALQARPQWAEDLALFAYVETELTFGRSPDQIAGRLRQDSWAHTVSHETIYAYIRRDAATSGDLWTFLRYQGKKHKWRGYSGTCHSIPNRRDIAERPLEVATKTTAGHWESDLVVSNRAGRGGAATFAERRTLAFRAVLVARCTADEMVRGQHRRSGVYRLACARR
jgi:transposase, IS30 family